MSVSSVSSSTTTSSSSSTVTNGLSADDFLSLLAEQLQNQDPLDPADTNEILNQLMTFASYQQEAESNTSLSDISDTLDKIASSLDISV